MPKWARTQGVLRRSITGWATSPNTSPSRHPGFVASGLLLLFRRSSRWLAQLWRAAFAKTHLCGVGNPKADVWLYMLLYILLSPHRIYILPSLVATLPWFLFVPVISGRGWRFPISSSRQRVYQYLLPAGGRSGRGCRVPWTSADASNLLSVLALDCVNDDDLLRFLPSLVAKSVTQMKLDWPFPQALLPLLPLSPPLLVHYLVFFLTGGFAPGFAATVKPSPLLTLFCHGCLRSPTAV